MNSKHYLFLSAIFFLTVFSVFSTPLHAESMPDYIWQSSMHIDRPTAVALDALENVYVVSSSRNTLNIYDYNGQHKGALSGLDQPTAVAVDQNYRLFIANAGRGNVEVYDANLVFLFTLGNGDGEFDYPTALAVDSAGNIYVTDGNADLVRVYGPEGNGRFSFGGSGNSDGLFNFPASIAYDYLAETILVTDLQYVGTGEAAYRGARIQVFDLAGRYLQSYGTYGLHDENLTTPLGIEVDSQRRIFVTDSIQNMVKVYDRYGNFLGVLNDPDHQMRNPLDLAIGADTNRLFVVSAATNSVDIYGLNIDHLITTGAGSGGTILPVGPLSVEHGDSQSFSILPDECYAVDTVWVNGVSAGSRSLYTFSKVTEDQSIMARFSQESYTISAEGDDNCLISPLGDFKVSCGEEMTFEIGAVDQHSYLESITVDGIEISKVETYRFADIHADHLISARCAKKQNTITVMPSDHGVILPGTTIVDAGSDLEFELFADECYQVEDVIVDSATSLGPVSSYRFSDISADHSIWPVFSKKDFAVISVALGGGKIEPSGSQTIACAGSASFSLVPDEGYLLESILINGSPVPTVNPYSINNLAADQVIEAVFAPESYSIAASSNTGGTVLPNGPVAVEYLQSQDFQIIPEPGYYVADVRVDGVSQGAADLFSFAAVTSDHTIEVVFAETLTVTASSTGKGSVSPGGENKVCAGESLTFIMTPEAFHHVEDLRIDGISIGPVTAYHCENITGNHTIEAIFSLDTFKIAAKVDGNGSIAPAGMTTIEHGEVVEFNMTPEVGYAIADVIVDGVSVGAVSQYIFEAVNKDHAIEVVFKAIQYNIIAEAEIGGTISPSGSLVVDHLADQLFTITASPGYKLSDLLVDGVSVGPLSAYALNGIEGDHRIEAKFIKKTYALAITASGNGTVSPAGITTLDHGDSLAVEITPAAGHRISDVLVDGISVGAVAEYSFAAVDADHILEAVFAGIEYEITASATNGGSILPTGQVQVGHLGSQDFAITADQGYAISDVLIDGVSIGAAGGYSFAGVDSNHSIEAVFAKETYPKATYTIGVIAYGQGEVSLAGLNTVEHGDYLTVALNPAAGHSLADVLIDGISIGAVSAYTFAAVDADHTLEAVFVAREEEQEDPGKGVVKSSKSHVIYAYAAEHGRITPSGVVRIKRGGSRYCLIRADKGYQIADVLVDGKSLGPLNSYYFAKINSDHRIAAFFVPVADFFVEADAGEGGFIEPSGRLKLKAGSSQRFMIAPETGYVIADVFVDGLSRGPVSAVNLFPDQNDHTVMAVFKLATNFTLKVKAEEGGKIVPAGIIQAAKGSDQNFMVVPANGYAIRDVRINGISVGARSVINLTAIDENISITASFALEDQQAGQGQPLLQEQERRADAQNGADCQSNCLDNTSLPQHGTGLKKGKAASSPHKIKKAGQGSAGKSVLIGKFPAWRDMDWASLYGELTKMRSAAEMGAALHLSKLHIGGEKVMSHSLFSQFIKSFRQSRSSLGRANLWAVAGKDS